MSTRELFARHSLRCTQQRVAVYESLSACRTHPTAEELYRLVRPRLETLSLATVYNALDALAAAGLARRLPTTDGCCRYDADTSPHLHVSLRGSSEIADVPPALSARLLDRLPQDVLDEIGAALGLEIEDVCIQLQATPRDDGAITS